MALQAAAELAQAQQLGVRDDSGRLEHRVEQRAGVALAEDQAIVAGVTGVGPVISQVFGEEHRHEVGGGHAGSRVTRPRFRRAADAVHTQLGRQCLPVFHWNILGLSPHLSGTGIDGPVTNQSNRERTVFGHTRIFNSLTPTSFFRDRLLLACGKQDGPGRRGRLSSRRKRVPHGNSGSGIRRTAHRLMPHGPRLASGEMMARFGLGSDAPVNVVTFFGPVPRPGGDK